MTGNENVIHCHECTHCFESRRSPTGHACEVWGTEDFACPTVPNGFCHKAKPKMSALYEKYKRDWCEARGYILEDMDERYGINGECYACFNEWYYNEYLESKGE